MHERKLAACWQISIADSHPLMTNNQNRPKNITGHLPTLPLIKIAALTTDPPCSYVTGGVSDQPPAKSTRAAGVTETTSMSEKHVQPYLMPKQAVTTNQHMNYLPRRSYCLTWSLSNNPLVHGNHVSHFCCLSKLQRETNEKFMHINKKKPSQHFLF